jgi:hypothetical protein
MTEFRSYGTTRKQAPATTVSSVVNNGCWDQSGNNSSTLLSMLPTMLPVATLLLLTLFIHHGACRMTESEAPVVQRETSSREPHAFCRTRDPDPPYSRRFQCLPSPTRATCSASARTCSTPCTLSMRCRQYSTLHALSVSPHSHTQPRTSSPTSSSAAPPHGYTLQPPAQPVQHVSLPSRCRQCYKHASTITTGA